MEKNCKKGDMLEMVCKFYFVVSFNLADAKVCISEIYD